MLLELSFWAAVLASGVRLATPTALAALGETVAQRSGVLNIGLEGMMMLGGFAGFATVVATGQVVVGLVAAVLAGAALGLVMAVVSVWRGGNQIVTGFALLLAGQGLANFLLAEGDLAARRPLPAVEIPLLSSLPLVGGAFAQSWLTYLTVALAVVVWWVLRSTRFGLEVDAAGKDAGAAAGKGVHVRRVRTWACLVAGGLAGLGGAALAVGALGTFTQNMVAGRGFVALALVVLGRQRVWLTMGAALLFATTDALQGRLQEVDAIPIELLPAAPWVVVVTLLVVAALGSTSRRHRTTLPEALP